MTTESWTAHLCAWIALFRVIQLPSTRSASFSIGSASLPLLTDTMAVIYDEINDTVLLFGGESFPKQLTMFKSHQHIFSAHDRDFLTKSQRTYSYSQHYTQLSTTLWMIRTDGAGFVTFDTKTYQTATPDIVIQPTVKSPGGPCLTATDNYLIVVGGGDYDTTQLNTVQIYDVDHHQWISNVPSLHTPRMSLACVALHHKVYAIGGYNADDTELSTIEVLDVSNIAAIASAAWYDFICTLQEAREGPRAVVYGADTIYVVGGWPKIGITADIVDIIHTESLQCTLAASLNYPVAFTTCVIADNILFVFGGAYYDAGDAYYDSRYQYLALPSLNASPMPTSGPEVSPTSHPTWSPIRNHSDSLSPTNALVTESSMTPTYDPTYNPSLYPSDAESTSITANPTVSDQSREVVESTKIESTMEVPSREIPVSESIGITDKMWITVILIAAGVCMCNVLLCGIAFCRKRPVKTYKNTHVQNIEQNIVNKNMIRNDQPPTSDGHPPTSGASGNPNTVADMETDNQFITPCESGHECNNDADILDAVNATGVDGERNGDIDEFVIGGDSDSDGEDMATVGKLTKRSGDDSNDVKLWLNSIGFGHYSDVFVNHGFDSMDVVKQINNMNDLDGIGITLVDELKIVNYIKKMKV